VTPPYETLLSLQARDAGFFQEAPLLRCAPVLPRKRCTVRVPPSFRRYVEIPENFGCVRGADSFLKLWGGTGERSEPA